MNIIRNQNDGSLIIALEGRLDTTTAPELEQEIKNRLDGVTELVMDFARLDYISSAGLRVLLSAQKVMGKQGSMKVIHANEMVMEVFEVTGFADILLRGDDGYDSIHQCLCETRVPHKAAGGSTAVRNGRRS